VLRWRAENGDHLNDKVPLHSSTGYISYGYRLFAWALSLFPGLILLVVALVANVPSLLSATVISGLWFLLCIGGFLIFGRSYLYVRDSEWDNDPQSLANAPKWLRNVCWGISIWVGLIAGVSVSSVGWLLAIPVGLVQFVFHLVFFHFFGFRIWLLFKKVFSLG
jgi:hypothetical protein